MAHSPLTVDVLSPVIDRVIAFLAPSHKQPDESSFASTIGLRHTCQSFQAYYELSFGKLDLPLKTLADALHFSIVFNRDKLLHRIAERDDFLQILAYGAHSQLITANDPFASPCVRQRHPNAERISHMAYAAASGNLEAVQLLLEFGDSIVQRPEKSSLSKYSSALTAAIYGQFECLQLIVSHPSFEPSRDLFPDGELEYYSAKGSHSHALLCALMHKKDMYWAPAFTSAYSSPTWPPSSASFTSSFDPWSENFSLTFCQERYDFLLENYCQIVSYITPFCTPKDLQVACFLASKDYFLPRPAFSLLAAAGADLRDAIPLDSERSRWEGRRNPLSLMEYAFQDVNWKACLSLIDAGVDLPAGKRFEIERIIQALSGIQLRITLADLLTPNLCHLLRQLNCCGHTALTRLCVADRPRLPDCVRLLLTSPSVEVDQLNHCECTALRILLQESGGAAVSIAPILLQAGACPNSRHRRESLLDTAFRLLRWPFVPILLQYNGMFSPSISRSAESVVRSCGRYSHDDDARCEGIIACFRHCNCDDEEKALKMLIPMCTSYRWCELFFALLEQCPDVDVEKYSSREDTSPIDQCMKNGVWSAIPHLIEAGFSVSPINAPLLLEHAAKSVVANRWRRHDLSATLTDIIVVLDSFPHFLDAVDSRARLSYHTVAMMDDPRQPNQHPKETVELLQRFLSHMQTAGIPFESQDKHHRTAVQTAIIHNKNFVLKELITHQPRALTIDVLFSAFEMLSDFSVLLWLIYFDLDLREKNSQNQSLVEVLVTKNPAFLSAVKTKYLSEPDSPAALYFRPLLRETIHFSTVHHCPSIANCFSFLIKQNSWSLFRALYESISPPAAAKAYLEDFDKKSENGSVLYLMACGNSSATTSDLEWILSLNLNPEKLENLLHAPFMEASFLSASSGRTYWSHGQEKLALDRLPLLMPTHQHLINYQRPIDHATPLHLAVGRRFPLCVKLLLNSEANPNAQNKDGDTPMHILLASTFRKIGDEGQQIFRSLFEMRSNLWIVNQKGICPLYQIREFLHPSQFNRLSKGLMPLFPK